MSGRRRPELLAEHVAPTTTGAVYVCGAKPLDFGELTLTEGVEVPGASEWPRLEAWITARRVRLAHPGELYTSYEDFKARWEEDHPAPVDTEQEPAEDSTEQE